ncbi:MAG: AmmeMemoRadiSam system protein A [Candidatus Aminicenantes bacterium]|nr:AmmeMemoRadiSam system protein A [Candidatus Aminicenantes bacterium]
MSLLLDKRQQNCLLRLARKAIEQYLLSGKTITPDKKNPCFPQQRGAFVTLKKGGKLRGCIGYPLPVKSLDETIIEMAVAASTEDPRFPVMKIKELPETKIEISVLGLPRPIRDVSEIKIGAHGIIVSQGPFKGLLLPQVPLEWNWDRKTFLRHGCLKAGLDEDAWEKEATVEIFTAQVFGE